MMKLISLIFCILFFTQSALFIRDVCILGSGASGMSAAVFLKDKGYDVVVLEKEDRIGGHCHSSYFDPPKHGDRDWLELGVAVFPDTAYENAMGIGNWTLNSRAFAQRFLPRNSTIGYLAEIPNYGFDYIHQIATGLIPPTPPTPEYLEAMERFITMQITQYPWLNNVHFPDPIPRELLVPFGVFIQVNNFTILNDFFFGLLYYGGMGNYKEVTTLYALQNLRVGIVKMYADEGAGFAIRGGCSKMYEGMSKFIGKRNILKNANVLTVQRNNKDYVYVGADVDGDFHRFYCKKILVTFPQLLENLGFIDLAQEEIDIFQNVTANFYYPFQLDTKGPITNTSYSVAGLDLFSPDRMAPFPTILVLRREVSYGPTGCFAFAGTDITDPEMLSVVNNYLSRLPPQYFTTFELQKFFRHFYQPHYPVDILKQSPTPYTRINNLQGQRNTYWTGALLTFAESATIWQRTKDLVDQYFPDKHHHHQHLHQHEDL